MKTGPGGTTLSIVASWGHVTVGLLAGRLYGGPVPARTMATFAALSLVPDLDVVPVALGLEDAGMIGHRGFSHTLLFALLGGAVAAWIARRSRAGPWRTGLLVMLTLASHAVLDAATTDTRGVYLAWPLSDARIALPVRPIPEAPTGLAFLSLRGLEVAAVEVLLFLPVTLLALWPPRALRARLDGARAALAGAAFVVGLALCLISARLWLETSPAVTRVWRPPARAAADQAPGSRLQAPGLRAW